MGVGARAGPGAWWVGGGCSCARTEGGSGDTEEQRGCRGRGGKSEDLDPKVWILGLSGA